MVTIDSGSECMDLMWIKNINFEKGKKKNLTGCISNNDIYTIEFLIIEYYQKRHYTFSDSVWTDIYIQRQ